MGNCIICGTSTDGPICDIHQEDVAFEFDGDHPSQLTPGRYYLGQVDGYADFGVFVDIGNVTGLLHRSKLDQRLESLNWEVGDSVFVQVNNVRDNGDIDLGWSIRQSERGFRGLLVDAPDGDYLADEQEDNDDDEPEAAVDEQSGGTPAEPDDEPAADPEPEYKPESEQSGEADDQSGGTPSDEELAEEAGTASETDETADIDRIPVEELREMVGDAVRLEGEVVSARQTSGPTVFELRDETGVVDCAAFVEAGVRAYPDVEADDMVRLDGEVRLRRDEIQVETESLVKLEGDAEAAVRSRMDAALEERARPAETKLLGDDEELSAVAEGVTDAATVIRRAVLESRPVVVRHDATTYFDRRPLEEGVYDMNDATKDVTRMLGDRERHDEKLPLFVFTAAGSTTASMDGLELLDVYGAPRVVLDGRPADEPVAGEIDSLVTAEERTAATVAATVAAAVNGDVRDELVHLPAVSYWDEVPEPYADLAVEADIDADTARDLREAIALEAFYQSYEDKRELIVDLLFEKQTGLAEQVADQFRTKLEAEVDTATANLDERTVNDAAVAVLDTDAYTHQYDFPPTRLLLDELHRRLDADVVIGVGTDGLQVRTDGELDLEAMVAALQLEAPDAGVSDPGARQPKVEFLAGEREAVLDAVVDAAAERALAASA
ncbi:DNA-binding protein [Halobacteriales archaeon SW_5_68_122]|nr:MAG: DNA-binding protein [Halobacteriales archaeon SW_5_68_122]